MSLEENKALVRRLIHEGIIGGNLAVIDELCSSDCVNHAATAAARHGTEGVKKVVAFSRAAQPDQRWTNEMLIAEGDLVVIHGIREATWQAESFRGIPTPKGKPVAVELVHIFRIANKKIVEHWAVRDDLASCSSLGPSRFEARDGPFAG
jgi:predicted ester cyclase